MEVFATLKHRECYTLHFKASPFSSVPSSRCALSRSLGLEQPVGLCGHVLITGWGSSQKAAETPGWKQEANPAAERRPIFYRCLWSSWRGGRGGVWGGARRRRRTRDTTRRKNGNVQSTLPGDGAANPRQVSKERGQSRDGTRGRRALGAPASSRCCKKQKTKQTTTKKSN